MRKLVWFSLGFTFSLFLSIQVLHNSWVLPLAIFAVCLVILLAISKWLPPWRQIAVFLLGCCIGLCWLGGYRTYYLNKAIELDGASRFISIEAVDYSFDSDRGSVGDGKIILDKKEYRVRYYLNDSIKICPGDQISGNFQFRLTTAEGEYAETHHQGEGVFLLMYVKDDCTIVSQSQIPAKYFPVQLRQKIAAQIERMFPDDTQGISKAVLLGDSTALSHKENDAFKISGIRHIVAVSGLHISILFSLVYITFGKNRFLTAVIGIPALLLFAAMAGFTPSVIRACIMQILMILAMLINREYDPPSALAFAVLVMLAVNPVAITSVSLLLSSGCICGIFLFSGKIYRYILNRKWMGNSVGKSVSARLKRWFASSISVSLGAMTLTTPLCAYYFGAVSIVGVLTNLLCLWLLSFIFYGIMISCAVGIISTSVGAAVAWLISWPIRLITLFSTMFASIPFAAVYTCSVYVVIWLVFSYLLFFAFVISKKKRPVTFAFCSVFVLVFSILVSVIEPKLYNYSITIMDVGQGQCILLQSDGKNFIVDCGGNNDSMAADSAIQKLRSQGITHLDGFIITHYDDDHAGGAAMLMSCIDTKKVFVTVDDANSNLDEEIKNIAGDRLVVVNKDIKLSFGNTRMRIFASEDDKSGNDSSLCILFQPNNCDILITGDRSISGENALLERVDLPDLEILVVGHHGSGNATGLQLLNHTRPDLAIISVGEQNAYGHPDPVMLNRLNLFQCEYLRTDEEGTIVLRG